MIFGLSEWWVLIITIASIGVLYLRNINQYFKKRGLNHIKPSLIFGNMFKIVTGQRHSIDLTGEIQKAFPLDRYAGFYNFAQPMILIKDLELIKKILIKDFDHFIDHLEFTDETVDPLMGKMLFSLQGDKWKEMRTTLSPAFTSSKMRGMLPFIVECAEIFTDYIKKETSSPTSNEKGYAEFELKEFTGRYAGDVIASCAFGIKVDSINEKRNYFYTVIKNVTNFSLSSIIKLYIFFLFPIITKIFKLELSNKESTNYFRSLTLDTMKMREEKNIVRNDMIHLLMQAKKGLLKNEINAQNDDITEDEVKENKNKKIEWTDDELIAQAFVFVFAGFDTVSTALGFLLHELTMNTDIQKRLQQEIDEFTAKYGDSIDYNNLNKMIYLDMVVSEALRLWPPAIVLDRKCVKPYALPAQNDNNKRNHMMQKGDGVWIPVYDIHRNPDIYKNPDKFDPERFSEENKSSLHSCAYLPFGGGPRICIGSRFALMEIKIFLFYILKKFEIVPTCQTCYPVKIKPDFFDLIAESGLWAGFKQRKINND